MGASIGLKFRKDSTVLMIDLCGSNGHQMVGEGEYDVWGGSRRGRVRVGGRVGGAGSWEVASMCWKDSEEDSEVDK